MRMWSRIAVVPAALLVGGVLVAPPAQAADVEREASGQCSGNARWDLNLERERGIVDLDFDVDRSAVGQRWTVIIKKNGTRVARISQTADRDGEIEISRQFRDSSASDRFTVRAVSGSGQVCRGSLRI